MKIQVMSDCHVDLWDSWYGEMSWPEFMDQIQTDADVLILAGDMFSLAPGKFRWSVARLRELGVRYRHVLYLPGNHESWGTSITQALDSLLTAEKMGFLGNVRVLNGNVVEIDGQRFLGGTMWFPKPPRGAEKIGDHYRIQNYEAEVYQEHRRFRSFLEQELRKGDVVATHHLPSTKSIAPRWALERTNPFFVAPDIEHDFIVPRRPALWVHGHTHGNFDYRIGPTQVVCNPRGYPGENPGFDPRLTIEL